MREIKFRAWDTKNKVIVPDIDMAEVIYDRCISCGQLKRTKCNCGCTFAQVDPNCDQFVVMQFTGLHDKSGREIYEGDIVKWFDISWEIKWGLGKWVIEGRLFAYDFSPINHGEMEVIGNIYENPELLKETQ